MNSEADMEDKKVVKFIDEQQNISGHLLEDGEDMP